jgi:hypothetical protein
MGGFSCEVGYLRRFKHHSRFFANARPEWDLRYFSNASALHLSGNAQYQTNFRGLNFAVWAEPALCSDSCRFRSAVCADVFPFRKIDAADDVDIPHRFTSPSSPFGLCRACFAVRQSRGCATRSPKGEAWWSQAGSNRRPLACHASALPAELWPLTRCDGFRSNRHRALAQSSARLQSSA